MLRAGGTSATAGTSLKNSQVRRKRSKFCGDAFLFLKESVSAGQDRRKATVAQASHLETVASVEPLSTGSLAVSLSQRLCFLKWLAQCTVRPTSSRVVLTLLIKCGCLRLDSKRNEREFFFFKVEFQPKRCQVTKPPKTPNLHTHTSWKNERRLTFWPEALGAKKSSLSYL